jgi:hypothetical protein
VYNEGDTVTPDDELPGAGMKNTITVLILSFSVIVLVYFGYKKYKVI